METPEWIRADGTLIRLSEMSTEHVMNVQRYLREGTGEFGPMVRPGCSGFTNSEWLLLLGAELLRRRQRM